MLRPHSTTHKKSQDFADIKKLWGGNEDEAAKVEYLLALDSLLMRLAMSHAFMYDTSTTETLELLGKIISDILDGDTKLLKGEYSWEDIDSKGISPEKISMILPSIGKSFEVIKDTKAVLLERLIGRANQ